jgi:ABC-2 type transport system permease protein
MAIILDPPFLDPLRIRAVIRRQAYVQLRAPQRWFDVLVWPMVDVVIWGSIGLFVDQQGGAGRAGAPYMLSGILLMHVMYQANV